MTEARVKEIAAANWIYKEVPTRDEARQLATDWLAQRAEIERLREVLRKLSVANYDMTVMCATGESMIGCKIHADIEDCMQAIALAALTSTQGDGK